MRKFFLSLCVLLFLPPLFSFENENVPNKKAAKKDMVEIQKIDTTRKDLRFALIRELQITVPNTYDHKTQLISFENENKNGVDLLSTEAFSDNIFTHSADELVPGRTYTIRVFSLTTVVSYDDCREFMMKEHVKFVGAPGISLLTQLKRSVFPKEKVTLSFGDLDVASSQKDRNSELVFLLPFIAALDNASTGKVWMCTILKAPKDFNTDYCLLCFYEE